MKIVSSSKKECSPNVKFVFNNLSSISEIRKGILKKTKEDLFRFRTCCADPRASK